MRSLLLGVSGALLLCAPDAVAQIEEGRAHPEGLAGSVVRPVGMAEFGVGWLTLPGAEVCGGQSSCTKGDTSLELEAWQLYRANLRFAFGAGVTLGLIPTTDAPRSEPERVPGEEPIERDHSRGYLTIEGIVRYYPFVGEDWEAWAGLTGGLVVVSDTFATPAGKYEDKALVGPRGITIRTEGYTIGLAAGAAYSLAANWSLGGTLRYGNWFLPSIAETDALGDQASLTGRTTMFAFGINIAYRVAL
jgi:opacity protein-like surface antigen